MSELEKFVNTVQSLSASGEYNAFFNLRVIRLLGCV